MLLEQSCEIAQKDPHDSRLLIAPVVFRKHWDGPFWKGIRSSAAPGLLFLPPMTTTERERYDVRGWPLNTDAAVVLESTTCVSRELVASGVAFGLSGQMRAVLQAKLAEFWSVRGWMRSGHRDTLVGKRIIEVLQTYEQFTGPGRLYKAILEDDSGEDEATVGLVLSP